MQRTPRSPTLSEFIAESSVSKGEISSQGSSAPAEEEEGVVEGLLCGVCVIYPDRAGSVSTGQGAWHQDMGIPAETSASRFLQGSLQLCEEWFYPTAACCLINHSEMNCLDLSLLFFVAEKTMLKGCIHWLVWLLIWVPLFF